jgi:hypothetical protein
LRCRLTEGLRNNRTGWFLSAGDSHAGCGSGSEARSAGWGGVSALSRITGMARSTIGRGLAELRSVATDVAVIGFAGVAAGGRNSPPAMPRCWMICSSVNRLRFIRPSPLSGRGLYLYLEGFSGLRSPRPTSSPNRSTQCDDRGKDRAPTEPSPDAKPRVRRFVITESSSKRAATRSEWGPLALQSLGVALLPDRRCAEGFQQIAALSADDIEITRMWAS